MRIIEVPPRGVLPLVVMLFVAVSLLSAPVAACGQNSDCKLGDRHYRIKLPDGHDGTTPVGAIVFAHGYQGSARGVIRNKRLLALAGDLNVALLALKSATAGWSLPGAPSSSRRMDVDEVTYVDRVLDDALGRFPIDPKRIIATGFSAGGMMVWTLACHRSHRFTGFAPMAGTFWRPTPETCSTPPANVVHVHGDADRTVPLSGRVVKDARQGDVPTVLEMYRRYGRFSAAEKYQAGRLRCERYRNPSQLIFDFCLFSGAHRFSADYVRHAWKVLVADSTGG